METIAKKRQTCPQCGKDTLFSQRHGSINWVLHLVMMIASGGLWIPVFLLFVSFSVLKIGFIQADWVCPNCGYVDREALKERRKILKIASLVWLVFYGVGLIDWMLYLHS
jgi:ribosomal protein S27AE